jgi:hypothetical protein
VIPIIDTSKLHRVRGFELLALHKEIETLIERDDRHIGSAKHAELWELNWREHLMRFNANQTSEALVPRFIKSGMPVRIDQEFYSTANDPDFELRYYRELQRKIIAPLCADCQRIFEFGCGSGFNLVELAKLFPAMRFFGLDYSAAAVELVEAAARALHLPIATQRFNMKLPGELRIPHDSFCFTFGAVEQLASDFKPFIDWLFEQRPRRVLHIEPTPELLDPYNATDALALKFMSKRGYTSGFLSYLYHRDDIAIQEVTRCFVGSMMIEGYNIVVWSPL